MKIESFPAPTNHCFLFGDIDLFELIIFDKTNILDKKKNKPPIFQVFMEYTWLAIGILSFITWLYSSIQEGYKDNLMLLGISVISLAMFFFRKYLRRQYVNSKDKTKMEK